MHPTIAQRYQEIRHATDQKAAACKYAFAGLSDQMITELVAAGNQFYRGKVRDLVIGEDSLRMIHSDRLTAFDKYIGLVPYKGVILNAINNYWLSAAQDVVPTHLIEATSDRELLVKKTRPFKVEVVVRGYLAGSIARAYANGERSYCGVPLDDGLRIHGKLPHPIITPTTKAEVFEHDENITSEELLARKIATPQEWDQIQKLALRLFAFGSEISAKQGYILVDAKYEFGRDEDGEIIVIDEIHTPDSSRFWVATSYASALAAEQAPEMLDKEVVRRWLMQNGFSGEGPVPEVPVNVLLDLGEVYLRVVEKLIGKPLTLHS